MNNFIVRPMNDDERKILDKLINPATEDDSDNFDESDSDITEVEPDADDFAFMEMCEKRLLDYHEDLCNGIVKVERYHANRIMRVDKNEDWDVESYYAKKYIIDIGNRNMLYFILNFDSDVIENSKFPCTDFELIRLPKANEIIAINCHGERIIAEDGRNKGYDYYNASFTNNGILLEGTFDDLDWIFATSDSEQNRKKKLFTLNEEIKNPEISSELRPIFNNVSRSFILPSLIFCLFILIMPIIMLINNFLSIEDSMINRLSSMFIDSNTYIILLIFIVVLILLIRFIHFELRVIRGCFKLATESLGTVPVKKIIDVYGRSSIDNNKKNCIKIFVSAEGVNVSLIVYPPLGKLGQRIKQLSLKNNLGTKLYNELLFSEEAELYIGRYNMIVIKTSHGVLVNNICASR